MLDRMASESDDALVQSVLDGQTAGFRTLVERYQDAVFAVALSKTGSHADAQDIAQEAFLAAYQSLGRLRDPKRFGSWLYGIALKQARMHLRRRSTERKATARAGSRSTKVSAASDEQAMRHELRDKVMAALQRLSEPSRETATLFYINGYSHQDIAAFTNRPLGTIKRRLHAARRQLRKELVNMVEGELKQSRPGKKFTKQVVRQIKKTRVWLGQHGQNYMLLTDARGRSTESFLGDHEAQAVLTTLGQRRGKPIDDSLRALVALLRELGFKVLEVKIGPSVTPDHLAQVKVRTPAGSEKTAESPYAGRDALQLAVHAQARFLLDNKIGVGAVRRKDGQPMSPTGAWRSIGRRSGRRYRNIDELLRTLERDPDNDRARVAVEEADTDYGMDMGAVDDRRDGVKKLRAWAAKHKNTPFEATAAGLVGAFYLAGHPHRGPGSSDSQKISNALRYLRRAHRLRPDDRYIAFDLASAYVKAGQLDKAVAMLPQCRAKDLGRCNNFRTVWKHPRFKQIAGGVDNQSRNEFAVKQLRLISSAADSEPEWKPCGFSRKAKSASQALRSELRTRLDLGPLAMVQDVSAPVGKAVDHGSVVLSLASDRVAAWAFPPWMDRRHNDLEETLKQADFPWMGRSETTMQILAGCGIEIVAVVLDEMQDGDVIGRIVAQHRRRQAHTRIDGLDAISIALNAKRPILITDQLADRLAVRGKSRRPLSTTGALRKLQRESVHESTS